MAIDLKKPDADIAAENANKTYPTRMERPLSDSACARFATKGDHE